jgi:hypothetical protein
VNGQPPGRDPAGDGHMGAATPQFWPTQADHLIKAPDAGSRIFPALVGVLLFLRKRV